MMKGLDTNVLIRYLVRDDKKQADLAAAYIQKAVADGEGCYINSIVVCEIVWVLESAYRYEKKIIADVLDKIVATRQFEIERKDITRQAVVDYRDGGGDLADYLIGRINKEEGCEVTASFDRTLKNSPAFVLLG